MTDGQDLGEEVVVVTGAARGLGYQIALELLERGARVVAGCSGDPAPLELLAEKWPHRVRAVVGDIGEEDTSIRLVEQAIALGGPTAVVHNAAISRDALLVRTRVEDWDDVQRVNLRGGFLVSKHAVRAMMRGRRGRLVYISSISAVLGNAGQASYAASKAGLDGLARSVSQEYARYGIQTCVLAAGLIDVGMASRLGERDQQAKLSRVLHGAAHPRDIAGIAAFLASPAAAYINATTVSADGGVRF